MIVTIQRCIYIRRYDSIISAASRDHGVPVHIIYAVIFTESRFNENAVSRVGAQGLMQLMPHTYDLISKELCIAGNPFDIEVNIYCGTYLLSVLYQKYGSWDIAFAAYNAGENAVDFWLSDSRYSLNGKLVNIPYKETAEYVKKVNNAAKAYLRIYNIK